MVHIFSNPAGICPLSSSLKTNRENVWLRFKGRICRRKHSAPSLRIPNPLTETTITFPI